VLPPGDSQELTDFSQKSDAEINQWISNFEKRGQTDAALYLELLEERGRRSGKRLGLDLESLCQRSSKLLFVGNVSPTVIWQRQVASSGVKLAIR